MTTVRIQGSGRDPQQKEWLGSATVDSQGRLERSLDLPEEVYQAIEGALAQGEVAGTVALANGGQLDWSLEQEPAAAADPASKRPLEAERMQTIAARDQLWASLRALSPEIHQLGEGHFNGSERERQILQLLARIVATELNFRAEEGR